MKTSATLLATGIVVLVAALAACDGVTDGNEDGSGDAASEVPAPARVALHARAAFGDGVRQPASRKRVSDRDETMTATLPVGWNLVRDSIEGSLVSASSFPFPGPGSGAFARGKLPVCAGGVLRDAVPPGEAVVRIWEEIPGPGNYRPAQAERRPSRLRLPERLPTSECGASYQLSFGDRGRIIAIWVWAGGDTLSARTRRQLTGLINSIELLPAKTVTVFRPWMALDCRNPPNTLGCDRVYVFVVARQPMRSLSVYLYDRSRPGKTWVRLHTAHPHRNGVSPPGSMPPRTVWTGVIRNAGFRRQGSALEIPIPPGRKRWFGVPPVAADLAVIARPVRDKWSTSPRVFRNIRLAAGHG